MDTAQILVTAAGAALVAGVLAYFLGPRRTRAQPNRKAGPGVQL